MIDQTFRTFRMESDYNVLPLPLYVVVHCLQLLLQLDNMNARLLEHSPCMAQSGQEKCESVQPNIKKSGVYKRSLN
jgi:hypothetical protein